MIFCDFPVILIFESIYIDKKDFSYTIFDIIYHNKTRLWNNKTEQSIGEKIMKKRIISIMILICIILTTACSSGSKTESLSNEGSPIVAIGTGEKLSPPEGMRTKSWT